MSEQHELLQRLKGGLIVSCQAEAHEPLHGSAIMAAMARAALDGGAIGIRANGPGDIQAVRKAVDLAIIGINKIDLPGFDVRITPRLSDVIDVLQAGADIVALDATFRPRPGYNHPADFIRTVKSETGCLVMADISTYEEGLAAAQAGADLVGTTLSGYTTHSPQQNLPDFALLEALSTDLEIPVIAEGRIATPQQARRCLELGAFAVTVGAAITRPQWITREFFQSMRGE